MGKRRPLTDQEQLMQLGIISVDDTGLPVTNEDQLTPSQVLESQEAHERAYGTNQMGNFASQIVYDPEKTGVIYRGLESDLQEDIYNSQSWFETFGNGMGRLLLTTGTKIGTGAAFLASMPYEIARGALTDVEGNFISRAADTGLVHVMEGLEEGVKNALPIYKSRYYQDGNVFQKATKIEFWMDDVVDGVAFALSSYVGGGAVSKLGTGKKLATAFRSGATRAMAKTANTADEITALANLNRLAGRIDKVTATALMTSSEAMFEAAEVQKSILNNPELAASMPQDKLNLLAAQRARDTYLLNVAAIAPSNLFEMSSLFNKIKFGGRKSLPSQKNADINFAAERTPGKLAGQLVDNTKEVTGVRALWSNPKSKLARTILGNMAMEGLYEENIQYSIQKVGEYANNNVDDPVGSYRSFADSLLLLWNSKSDLATGLRDDPERLQAAVLGSIIGGGQSSLSNVPALNKLMGGDGGILAEERNNKEKRDKLLKALNDPKLDLDLSALDIWERTPERKVSFRIEKDTSDPTDPNKKKFFINDTGEAIDEKEVTLEEFEAKALEASVDLTHPDFEIGKAVEGKVSSTIMVDSQGNPIINEAKLRAKLAAMQRKETLDDIHEAMSQNPDANKLGLTLIRNEKLALMADEHFRAGMAHLLYDKLDMISKATPEELAAFGLSPSDNIQQITQQAKEYVRALETLYNNIQNGLLPDTNSTEDAILNEERKRVAYDRGQRIITLQQLIKNNLAELDTLSKDVESFLNSIKLNDTTNADLNELRVALDLLTNTLRNSDAADPINNNPGVIKEFNNELGRLLNRINELIDKISAPVIPGEQTDRKNRLDDSSIISPYHTLKNKLERIEAVNEELMEELNSTVDEYRQLTDITITNKLATAANVLLGIFTGPATLGLINYDRFLGMRTKGFQYYKNNRTGVLTKYAGRAGRNIILDENTTLEQYNKFLARRLRFMKLSRKLQRSNRMMFGNMWKDFLKEGGSFGDLIKLILDTEAILTPEAADEIIALVEERVSRYMQLKQLRDDSIQQAKDLSEKLELIVLGIEDVTEEEQQEIYERREDAWYTARDLDHEMEIIASDPQFDIANPEELIKLLRSRTIDHLADKDDMGLEREVVDELMSPATAALSAFEKNTEYENIEELRSAKKQLEALKRLYNEKREALDNESFNNNDPGSFWRELNELIDKVDAAILEVEKRLNDRARAELMAYKNYVQSLHDLLFDDTTGLIQEIGGVDSLLQSKIDEAFAKWQASVQDLQSKPDTDPLSMLEATIAVESVIWSVMKSLKLDNDRKDLVDKVLKQMAEMQLTQIKVSPFYNELLGNTGGGTKMVDANLGIMPIGSLAKGILSTMFISVQSVGSMNKGEGLPFDMTPESAYGKYLTHRDLHILLADLENEDRSGIKDAPASKDEIITMLKVLIRLKAIKELQQPSNFNQVNTNVYEGLLASLKAQKTSYDKDGKVTLLPFSLKQRTALFQLMRFIYTPNSQLTNNIPGNLGYWAYMKGAAGTGKTEVIVKWLNSMLSDSFDDSAILIGASNPNAAKSVNNSMPSEKGGLEFDAFIKAMNEAADGNKTISLIVFDEIGALNVNQLIQFKEATDRLLAINANLKVIVLGDPNQLVKDDTGLPSIEQNFAIPSLPGLPFVQQIDPLTVRYRSDNSAIVNIQDGFIGKQEVVTGLVGKMNVNPKEITSNDQPMIGSYVEDTTGTLLTILKNNVETAPTRKRAIIVNTEEQKKSWQSKIALAFAGKNIEIEVYTVQEAQGMSIEEVYVDMPMDLSLYSNKITAYNKALYTATSRARDFLYVGNIKDSSTVSDPNIQQVMEALAASKKLGYDMSIANLEKQKEYRDIFDDGSIAPAGETPAASPSPSPAAPAPTTGTTATPPAPAPTPGPTSTPPGSTPSSRGSAVETTPTPTSTTPLTEDKLEEDADIAARRLEIEREKQEAMSAVGKKQKASYFKKLRDPETDTPEKKANEIMNIRNLQRQGGTLTPEELQEVKDVEDALAAEGYEIVDQTGMLYHEGYKMIVEQSIPDDTLEEGVEIISTVIEPLLTKDGKMVKAPRVKVTVGTKKGGLTREQWLEQRKQETSINTVAKRYDRRLAELDAEAAKRKEAREATKKPVPPAEPTKPPTEPPAEPPAPPSSDPSAEEKDAAEEKPAEKEDSKKEAETVKPLDKDEDDSVVEDMSYEDEMNDVTDQASNTELNDGLSDAKKESLSDYINRVGNKVKDGFSKIFKKNNLLSKDDLHTQNYAFYSMNFTDDNGNIQTFRGLREELNMKDGNNNPTPMYAVKTYTDPSNPNSWTYSIVIKLDVPTDPNNTYFARVAVLSQKGYDRLPANYKELPSPVLVTTVNNNSTGNTILKAKVPSSQSDKLFNPSTTFYMTDTSDNPSRALQVSYSKQYSNLNGNTYNKILRSVRAAGFDIIENDISITVFNDKALKEFNSKYPGVNFPITKGIPYLVIPSRNAPNTPLLIRLSPKRISRQNYSTEIELMNQFISEVETFQKLTGKLTSEGKLTRTLTLGMDRDFNQFIAAMSNIYQSYVPGGPNNTVKENLTKDGKLESNPFYGPVLEIILKANNVTPNKDAEGNLIFDEGLFREFESLFHSAYKIDSMVHGERRARRAHTGEVQKAFDKLAKSNLVWYPNDNSTELILLRDVRNYGSGKIIVGGRSLLGSTNKDAADILGRQDPNKASIINKLIRQAIIKYVQDNGTKPSQAEIDELREVLQNQRFTKEFSINNGAPQLQFTTDQLKQLISLGLSGSSNLNRGFGIRVPIQVSMVNDRLLPGQTTTGTKTRSLEIALEEYFEVNFDSVNPTTMSIFIGSKPITEALPTGPTETPTPATEPVTEPTLATEPEPNTSLENLMNELSADTVVDIPPAADEVSPTNETITQPVTPPAENPIPEQTETLEDLEKTIDTVRQQLDSLEQEKEKKLTQLNAKKTRIEKSLNQVNQELDSSNKSVDEVIDEQVTDKEIEKIGKEEGIEAEDVKDAIREEIVEQLNDEVDRKKRGDKTRYKLNTTLKKVAARIKKLLLNLAIIATFMTTSSFSYPTATTNYEISNLPVENLTSFDSIRIWQDELNKKDNLSIIVEANKNNVEKYIIVDKANGVAHIYQGDVLLNTFQVGVGSNVGDQQTRLSSLFFNAAGEEVSPNEATYTKNGRAFLKDGYSSRINWDDGNQSTGAGIFTIAFEGIYRGDKAFYLKNERGIATEMALHKATDATRRRAINDNDPSNNRITNGCVNFNVKDLEAISDEGITDGSQVFILPDNPHNRYKIVDGKLTFTSSDVNVNRTPLGYQAKPITLRTSRYLRPEADQFVQALANYKEQLMGMYPTVSNDVYNRITRVAYGIMGQESSFGTYGGPRGQYGRVRDRAQVEAVKLGAKLNPSLGLGQIRITTIKPSIREALNINTQEDLLDPVKNAQAVMASLLDAYVNQINSKQKDRLEQILPVIHSNQRRLVDKANKGIDISKNTYVKSVNDKAKELTVYLGEAVNSLDDVFGEPMNNQDGSLFGLGLLALLRRRRIKRELSEEQYKDELSKLRDSLVDELEGINRQINNYSTDMEAKINDLRDKLIELMNKRPGVPAIETEPSTAPLSIRDAILELSLSVSSKPKKKAYANLADNNEFINIVNNDASTANLNMNDPNYNDSLKQIIESAYKSYRC